MSENVNKKKKNSQCSAMHIYIPRNRGLNIKFLPVRRSIIRRLVKHQLVYVTSRMCTVTTQIGTSVELE